MANLIINALTDELDTIQVKGRVSFTHEAEYVPEDDQWVDSGYVKGLLCTHDYIPDIRDIRSPRYQLSDITVIRENFGSEDFNIYYDFIAYKHDILPDPISKEDVAKLEEKAYSYEKDNCGFLYGVDKENEED